MPQSRDVIVDIGDVAVLFRTPDVALADMLERRFARFLKPSKPHAFAFDVAVRPFETVGSDADLRVQGDSGRWRMQRGDFAADWNVDEGRGHITLTRNPYAVDSVLRVVHTLLLSRAGGFLLHASSAIRHGRAFVFAGPSGAGKSTIASLAPADAMVLSDEISYIRKTGDGYMAFGTPFSGEMSDSGEPGCAPVAALFALGRGADNAKVPLTRGRTVQTLMRNILFFVHDRERVKDVFEAACRFAARVPAYELLFLPDARVWSGIQ
jgi:hypothetical protein